MELQQVLVVRWSSSSVAETAQLNSATETVQLHSATIEADVVHDFPRLEVRLDRWLDLNWSLLRHTFAKKAWPVC